MTDAEVLKKAKKERGRSNGKPLTKQKNSKKKKKKKRVRKRKKPNKSKQIAIVKRLFKEKIPVQMNPKYIWPNYGGQAVHRYGYQGLIADDARYVHKESLKDFAEKQGKGFTWNQPHRGNLAKYIFIVTPDDIIRYSDLDDPEAMNDRKWLVNPGHSSLLPQKDYMNAYENKGTLVKYAGDFYVNKQGKVVKWDNICDHFRTSWIFAPQIAMETGFDPDLFNYKVDKDSKEYSIASRETLNNMLQSSYYDGYDGYDINNQYTSNALISPFMIDTNFNHDIYAIYAIYAALIMLLACIILYVLCFINGILCGQKVSEQMNEKKHDINSDQHLDICMT